MFYIYDETLEVLRLEAKEAVEIARFCDSILVTNKIEEAVLIADYPKSALLLHPKNRYSIFRYSLLQLRHRTLKEFRIILYAAEASWLYYFLKTASFLSFRYYRFIPFKKVARKEVSMLDLTQMRQNYTLAQLNEDCVDPDPLKQFEIWSDEAKKSPIRKPNAILLATCGHDLTPSKRTKL